MVQVFSSRRTAFPHRECTASLAARCGIPMRCGIPVRRSRLEDLGRHLLWRATNEGLEAHVRQDVALCGDTREKPGRAWCCTRWAARRTVQPRARRLGGSDMHATCAKGQSSSGQGRQNDRSLRRPAARGASSPTRQAQAAASTGSPCQRRCLAPRGAARRCNEHTGRWNASSQGGDEEAGHQCRCRAPPRAAPPWCRPAPPATPAQTRRAP